MYRKVYFPLTLTEAQYGSILRSPSCPYGEHGRTLVGKLAHRPRQGGTDTPSDIMGHWRGTYR